GLDRVLVTSAAARDRLVDTSAAARVRLLVTSAAARDRLLDTSAAARDTGANEFQWKTKLVRRGREPVRQEVRFCSSPDGTRLAYAIHGRGAPLVRTATWLTHLELDWNSPVWRHWLEELGDGRMVLRYDERGCGLSDRDVADVSLDARVSDLEA